MESTDRGKGGVDQYVHGIPRYETWERFKIDTNIATAKCDNGHEHFLKSNTTWGTHFKGPMGVGVP